MPTALLSVEIAVAVVLVLVAVFLATTYARRRVISRGAILFGARAAGGPTAATGGVWATSGSGTPGWSGSACSASPHAHSAAGTVSRVDLESPRAVRRSDVIDFMPDAVPVPCTDNGVTFELALTPGAYTALRSWSEASPPGSTANVA